MRTSTPVVTGKPWDESKRTYPLIRPKGGIPIRLRLVRDTWHADFHLDGRRIQRSLRTKSLGIARMDAREISLQLARQEGSPETRAGRAGNLESLKEEFLAWAADRLRPRTVQGYRVQLDAFVPWALEEGLTDAAQVRRPDVERYKTTIRKTVVARSVDENGRTVRRAIRVPVANATLDRHAAGISAMFAYAVRHGRIETNPAHGVRREARVLPNAPRNVPVETIRRVLAVPSPWRLPIAIAYYAGLRLGEIRHLRWASIDLPESGAPRITVEADPATGWVPKTHHRRTIPLNSQLRAILEETPPDMRTGYVWPEGMRYTSSRPLQRWLAAHGFPPMGFHALRHSFGATLAAAGEPFIHIQRWMGHASVTTTQIYTPYVPGAEAGIEKLNLEERSGA